MADWHPQYRISTIKNATWTAVRVVFQERTGIVCEDQHVIAKFEALRSSFSRELRKLKESKKSGAGAEDVRKVTWPFFSQMTFLRGSVSLDNYVTSNMCIASQCRGQLCHGKNAGIILTAILSYMHT
nr:hypothetical protein BaRGS_009995 [Batillaria attramentaria]